MKPNDDDGTPNSRALAFHAPNVKQVVAKATTLWPAAGNTNRADNRPECPSREAPGRGPERLIYEARRS
eukprot:15443902-Alexandrium_andersonii.AAC.1